MTPIDYRSTPLVDINRAEIAGLVDQYLASGGEIHEVDGVHLIPFPPRTTWVDQDAVSRRKLNGLSRRERSRLRKMSEAL